jgi:hypothetical protein
MKYLWDTPIYFVNASIDLWNTSNYFANTPKPAKSTHSHMVFKTNVSRGRSL